MTNVRVANVLEKLECKEHFRIAPEKIRALIKATLAGRFYLSIYFICLRSHDEIILMQALDLMSTPSEVLVARNHKNLVHRLLVNLVMDGNHKILLLSPVG